MTPQPDPPPSSANQIAIATAVGMATGVALDRLATGTGVCIVLGATPGALQMHNPQGVR